MVAAAQAQVIEKSGECAVADHTAPTAAMAAVSGSRSGHAAVPVDIGGGDLTASDTIPGPASASVPPKSKFDSMLPASDPQYDSDDGGSEASSLMLSRFTGADEEEDSPLQTR